MTLTSYHANLKQALQEAFPVLQTVESYRIGETLATPAILTEIEHMSVGDINSEGKTPVVLSMALHCILGHGTPNLELEVRNFAAQTLVLLRNNYIGFTQDIDAPGNLQAQPSEFKPGKGGFESVAVTYEQTIYLGDPAFDLTSYGLSTELNFDVVFGGVHEREAIVT